MVPITMKAAATVIIVFFISTLIIGFCVGETSMNVCAYSPALFWTSTQRHLRGLGLNVPKPPPQWRHQQNRFVISITQCRVLLSFRR
jgi:hypothetical protein